MTIFLDFDGVLRVRAGRKLARVWSRLACSNLAMLLASMPNTRVVVCSSWRIGRTDQELKTLLESVGVAASFFSGSTPHLPGQDRGSEILEYQRATPDPDFIVIEDNPLGPAFQGRQVQPDYRFGLSSADCRRIYALFQSAADVSPMQIMDPAYAETNTQREAQ